jgi:hypothetical protein
MPNGLYLLRALGEEYTEKRKKTEVMQRFLVLNQNARETRTAVYQWNGFGFSGIENSELVSQCEQAFN